MTSPRQLDLALFFTRGVSLRTWEHTGLLEREMGLYRCLQEQGVRVTFVTYGDASDLDCTSRLPGCRILCNRWGLPRRLYERWMCWLHAPWLRRAQIIKTNQTDGAYVALQAARLWRKPLVARCGYMWSDFEARAHGAESAAAQRALKVESEVFSAAERIVVTTPIMAADIAQRIPGASAQTTVIPNYVDTTLFKPISSPGRPWDVVFVGRMEPQKNVASLLEAIEPLGVSAALIGDGQLRAELQQRSAGLDGRLLWKRSVPNCELPRLLSRSTLFVLPSHYEGHPKALIEAMACGLAVIGANSPGVCEVIRHQETGWLCSTGPHSIRKAILTLLGDQKLRRRLGRNAREYVLDNCALDRVAKMEFGLLSQTVAGGGLS